jgi:hypothetical protein
MFTVVFGRIGCVAGAVKVVDCRMLEASLP